MIEFKTKIASDGSFKIPELKRSHCDLNWFRTSKQFEGLANSDLFLLVLKRELKKKFNEKLAFNINNLPDGITVKTGFLSTITISL